jgi:O-methyltransferase involved in polyketide biosynthesis
MDGTDRIDVAGLQRDPVGWTLLATLYLRAWESRGPAPILGDRHAAAALERLTYDPVDLHRRTRPEVNQYLVALRARMLDEWAADFLVRHPDAVVLHVGCGLDSRGLRLDPPAPALWVDLDLPEVVAVRRRLYPALDRHRALAASVTDPGWWAELPADRPLLVVAEGLLMYLDEADVRALLVRVAEHAGRGGEIVFDGVAPWLARLGPTTHWGLRDGREVERWDPRLRLLERRPIGDRGDLVPNRAVRAVYRIGDRLPVWRRMLQGFRFAVR